jgi:Zn-dependent protease
MIPPGGRVGFLSIPLRHIDPLGFLMLVTLRFGWAKPVRVDMRRFPKPKGGMALTAFAGPGPTFC